MNKFLLLCILLFLISPVSGARVGLVVEFPNGGIFTKCLTVDEGTNGYEILKESGLKIEWSYDPGFGHGLCSILDIGCPSSNCYCSTSYWNFYIKGINEDSWRYSAVGFDGGSSCKEHYCARDGDLIGFTYNVHGDKPGEFSFGEVCPKPKTTSTIQEGPGIIGMVISSPKRTAGAVIGFLIFLLLVAYFVYKPWQYF